MCIRDSIHTLLFFKGCFLIERGKPAVPMDKTHSEESRESTNSPHTRRWVRNRTWKLSLGCQCYHRCAAFSKVWSQTMVRKFWCKSTEAWQFFLMTEREIPVLQKFRHFFETHAAMDGWEGRRQVYLQDHNPAYLPFNTVSSWCTTDHIWGEQNVVI